MLKWDLQRVVMKELAPSPAARKDAAILKAWERRKSAHEELERIQAVDRSDEVSPDEWRLWGVIKRAEEEISAATAYSPAGIEAQLWVYLYHTVAGPELHEDAAFRDGDLEALEAMGDRLDASDRPILSAIRSLRNMEVS